MQSFREHHTISIVRSICLQCDNSDTLPLTGKHAPQASNCNQYFLCLDSRSSRMQVTLSTLCVQVTTTKMLELLAMLTRLLPFRFRHHAMTASRDTGRISIFSAMSGGCESLRKNKTNAATQCCLLKSLHGYDACLSVGWTIDKGPFASTYTSQTAHMAPGNTKQSRHPDSWRITPAPSHHDKHVSPYNTKQSQQSES